jgi:hypothetical protein
MLASVLLGGCALLQPSTPTSKVSPLGPAEIRSASAAQDALAIGKSTKAEVRATLGEAVVIDFHSGYEVWVYREQPREKAAFPTTELVLLFEPSGVLAKARTR